MVGLDFFELMLIGVMVLLFVGPEKMPTTVRTLGKIYGQLRRAADELRRALVIEADRMDEQERLRQLVKRRREAEARRAAEAAGTAEAEEPVAPAPGPMPQPVELLAADEAVEPAGQVGAADGLPSGFSAEEWESLPAHVKELVRRRKAAT